MRAGYHLYPNIPAKKAWTTLALKSPVTKPFNLRSRTGN